MGNERFQKLWLCRLIRVFTWRIYYCRECSMQEIGSSKNCSLVARLDSDQLWDVGDFSQEGFCPSWKIHRRDFFPPCKEELGVIISTLQKKKNMGVIMSIYTKMGRGDFVREGFCPAPNTDITRSCPAFQIFVPEFLVSLPTRSKWKRCLRLIPSVEEVAKYP